jgi:DNA-binding GntR family transcriptional regulator
MPVGEKGLITVGLPLEPLQRDSIPERIAAQLREGIVAGRPAPGEPVREVEVARQLGVSRGPVREALQRLVQEGLLEAQPARGVFVRQLTADDIEDLYLARAAIEITAARILAASPSPEHIARLRAALAALEAAPVEDWSELARLDLQLHEVLVSSTGSRRLVRMFTTLSAETRVCMVALEPFYEDHAQMIVEHADIVSAISRGNQKLAVELLGQHMSDSVKRLTGRLHSEETETDSDARTQVATLSGRV